jgi:hypothetical protein
MQVFVRQVNMHCGYDDRSNRFKQETWQEEARDEIVWNIVHSFGIVE